MPLEPRSLRHSGVDTSRWLSSVETASSNGAPPSLDFATSPSSDSSGKEMITHEENMKFPQDMKLQITQPREHSRRDRSPAHLYVVPFPIVEPSLTSPQSSSKSRRETNSAWGGWPSSLSQTIVKQLPFEPSVISMAHASRHTHHLDERLDFRRSTGSCSCQRMASVTKSDILTYVSATTSRN